MNDSAISREEAIESAESADLSADRLEALMELLSDLLDNAPQHDTGDTPHHPCWRQMYTVQDCASRLLRDLREDQQAVISHLMQGNLSGTQAAYPSQAADSSASASMQAGADAVSALLVHVEQINRQTDAVWASDSEADAKDDPTDYRQLVRLLEQCLSENFANAQGARREGFLRGLAAHLCLYKEGSEPGPAFDPIAVTAASFSPVKSRKAASNKKTSESKAVQA